MTLKKITKYLVISTGLIWLIYDIIPATNNERGDTISEFMSRIYFIKGFWFLPLVISVLVGHWFIPTNMTKIPHDKLRTQILLLVGVISLMLNLTVIKQLSWYIIIPLGLVLGRFLFPQRKPLDDSTQ